MRFSDIGPKAPLIAVFVGLLTATPVVAADMEWRGFLTTGASFTDSKTSYQGRITRKARVSEETYLGLNLSKELSPEWRVAAQILARGNQADSAAKVDWAFVTYEPNSTWNLSLGRQKIPMWMVSAYIDVGRAYPWVIPPEEVYSLFNLKAFSGAAFAYSLPFGSSTLTLRPYGGDVIIESAPNSPTRDSKIRGTNMFGGSADWTLDKTTFRLAYNRALWNLNLGTNANYGTRKIEIFTTGIKSDWQGWWFSAEYAAIRDNSQDDYEREADELNAEAGASTDPSVISALRTQAFNYRVHVGGSSGYYATLGKQIESWLLHLTYAEVNRKSRPDISRDQQSLALGLNYDVNVDSVIKLEGKKIFLPLKSQGLFDTVPSDREAMVYRIGYSMIF
jgi:hypothetical protein